ncbi:MAG: helix-turn-helix domain-containing protein [Candidatus Methylacidiphilales bacterium]
MPGSHYTSIQELFRIEDFSTLKPSLLWCYEGIVHEPNRHGMVAEPHTVAWLLVSGNVHVETAGKGGGRVVLDAVPGQWLFAGPAERRQDFSDDASILSISFRLEWPSGDPLIAEPCVLDSREFPALVRAARPLAKLVQQHFPGVRAHLWKCGADLVLFFEMQRLFSAWLAVYLRAMVSSGIAPARSPGIDPRVLEIVRRLDHYDWRSEQPLQDEALAREVGLGPRQLDRLFIQQLGQTPRAYLQKCRLGLATALLTDVSVTVKQIAYDLGFSSPSHFSNWFREATGRSPRAYRQNEAG